ncbi:MAG: hypothetical protein SGJ27_04745 [Candidatus Melainabacteria bacterium]|nr:hypothetical protein [Candidatus Melainabacteria bacterium]
MGRYNHDMLRGLGGEMLEIRDGYARAQLPLSEKVMRRRAFITPAQSFRWLTKSPQRPFTAARSTLTTWAISDFHTQFN